MLFVKSFLHLVNLRRMSWYLRNAWKDSRLIDTQVLVEGSLNGPMTRNQI